MLAASPAPDCTATAKPSLMSFWTTSGTVATRFSPGNTSFGIPIVCGMFVLPLDNNWRQSAKPERRDDQRVILACNVGTTDSCRQLASLHADRAVRGPLLSLPN